MIPTAVYYLSLLAAPALEAGLGHDAWRVREAAEALLVALPPARAALPRLAKSKDIEVRVRVRRLREKYPPETWLPEAGPLLDGPLTREAAARLMDRWWGEVYRAPGTARVRVGGVDPWHLGQDPYGERGWFYVGLDGDGYGVFGKGESVAAAIEDAFKQGYYPQKKNADGTWSIDYVEECRFLRSVGRDPIPRGQGLVKD